MIKHLSFRNYKNLKQPIVLPFLNKTNYRLGPALPACNIMVTITILKTGDYSFKIMFFSTKSVNRFYGYRDSIQLSNCSKEK